jgi:hypothetical protein
MKKIIWPILLLASIGAYAGEKGNGGETVNVDNIPRLRDLVEKTTCQWVSGQVIMTEHKLLNDILKRVSALDWYFGEELKQEILSLDYCFTSRLEKINTNDYGSIITTYNHRASQVAIRLNRQVFIDQEVTVHMPELDRNLLIVHEAMHTYIGSKVYMRNNKVRSQVKAIEAAYNGQIFTTETFQLQMKNNELDFPLSANRLAPFKDGVMYLMGDYSVQRSLLLQAESIDSFFKKMKMIDSFDLAQWHQISLQASTLKNFVGQAVVSEDTEVLKRLLSDSDSVRETTLSILYNAQESSTKDLLKSPEAIEFLMRSFFSELTEKKVEINEEGRIVIKGMEFLSTNESEGTPFTSLLALDQQSYKEAHPKLRSFMNIVKQALSQKDDAFLTKIVYQNPQFYRAFDKSIKTQILSADVSFPLERTTALKKVDTLVDGVWILLKAEVTQTQGASVWKKFTGGIDQKRLGYKIN